MLLALLVLGVAGALAAAARVRWGIILLLAVGLELILVPPLTHGEWRFTLPAQGPIAAAAAIGGWALWRRLAASARLKRAFGKADRRHGGAV
jgi:hypothetical protein